MEHTRVLLEHSGKTDGKTIDELLTRLRRNKDFQKIDNLTGKRVYAIVVECLENILRHSVSSGVKGFVQPSIAVTIADDGLAHIKTGNTIDSKSMEKLQQDLDSANTSDEEELCLQYEKRINSEIDIKSGAGLGLMMMRIKSGNKIDWNYRTIGGGLLFFQLEVIVKKYSMRKLAVNKTGSSPKVYLDPEREIFEISGESRPPDVAGFYSDILKWFDEYSRLVANSDKDAVNFDFDLDYFNSTSAKYILDLCKKIAEVRSKGKMINVRWHYEPGDADMLEAGREMSRMARFPFEFKLKTSE